MKTSRIIKKKRIALDRFRHHLLSSSQGKNVGKIILFGSLKRKKVRADSDVDILVLACDKLSDVENATADAALETGLEIGESVEPLVYSFADWRFSTSYFLYNIAQNGEEIYSMEEAQIRREESRGYRDLALEYIEGALDSFKSGHHRLAVDATYNAAELCAKGLLLFKMDRLPTSHGGVVTKFSEIYIKEGKVQRSLGRALNKSLALRNKSRYDRHAIIGPKEVEEVRNLAEEMIRILDKELSETGNNL